LGGGVTQMLGHVAMRAHLKNPARENEARGGRKKRRDIADKGGI